MPMQPIKQKHATTARNLPVFIVLVCEVFGVLGARWNYESHALTIWATPPSFRLNNLRTLHNTTLPCYDAIFPHGNVTSRQTSERFTWSSSSRQSSPLLSPVSKANRTTGTRWDLRPLSWANSSLSSSVKNRSRLFRAGIFSSPLLESKGTG